MTHEEIYRHYQQKIEELRHEKPMPEFYNYAIAIYKHFAAMKPRAHFTISRNVKKQNIHNFMKAVVLYICDFGDIYFNHDYTEIIKHGNEK